MTQSKSVHPNFYETPSEAILQNRRAFYLSQKENAEPIAQWFYRIRQSTRSCNFGTLNDFLLIDKFICGLDSDEVQWIRQTDMWSLDQWINAIIDQINKDTTTEDLTILDNFLKVELDNIENDESFVDTNDVSIDSDENQQLSELKLRIEKEKNRNEVFSIGNQNGTSNNETLTLNSDEPERKLKGFTIDGDNRFHCLDCGKSFKQKATYTQHQRLHTGKNLLTCKMCGKIFIKPSKLKLHLLKHERDQSVAGKSFECHLCKFQFLRIQGLRIHINLKHVSNIKNDFPCNHCNDTFTTQSKLYEHLRSEHELNVAHKCPHCDQEFAAERLSELKQHLLTHSEIKPFMCEVCGNSFKTRKQLHLHMARHTNERRFKCGECGQMLKSRSNYKNHMRQHTGERPFKCDYDECGKTFVQRANYLKHLRWHSGDKPHGCNYCEKRFPTAYDMKLHVNSIHTGAKPFECHICNRRFSQPSTLRVHRIRVHR